MIITTLLIKIEQGEREEVWITYYILLSSCKRGVRI